MNNSTVQNNYLTPVGMYGSGSAANEPYFLQNGVLITKNKYLISTGPHTDPNNDSYHQVQIWLYYIQGNLDTFLDIDLKYLTSEISGFRLTTVMSGSNLMINFNIATDTTTAQMSQSMGTGWNLINIMNSCSHLRLFYNK